MIQTYFLEPFRTCTCNSLQPSNYANFSSFHHNGSTGLRRHSWLSTRTPSCFHPISNSHVFHPASRCLRLSRERQLLAFAATFQEPQHHHNHHALHDRAVADIGCRKAQPFSFRYRMGREVYRATCCVEHFSCYFSTESRKLLRVTGDSSAV